MWFILKEHGIKASSLASVKRFQFSEMELPPKGMLYYYQYVHNLPMYTKFRMLAATEHHFIISLGSIIRQCIGRCDIASALIRYPVETEELFM